MDVGIVFSKIDVSNAKQAVAIKQAEKRKLLYDLCLGTAEYACCSSKRWLLYAVHRMPIGIAMTALIYSSQN